MVDEGIEPEPPGPGRPRPDIQLRGEARDDGTVFLAGANVNYYSGPHGPDGEGPGRTSVHLPHCRREHPLRGRDELVVQLIADLPNPARPTVPGPGAVHVLHGLGGCGKTEIAYEVADVARRWGLRTWWVHAGGRATLSAGMREVAVQLGASRSRVAEAWSGRASAMELVWEVLEASGDGWLLVFDNADLPEYLAAADHAVADGVGWLRRPPRRSGMVIVTSRTGDEGIWGHWSTRHRVQALQPEYGAEILMDYFRAHRPSADAGGRDVDDVEEFEDAMQMSRQLGGLPLALRAVGAFLNQENQGPVWRSGGSARTIGTYRAAFERHFREAESGSGDADGEEDLGLAGVEQICDLSLDLLADRGLPHARPLLRALAFFAAVPIPYGAVLSPRILSASPLFGRISESRIRHLIGALDDFALIDLDQREPYDPTFSYVLTLHPLIRSAALAHRDVRADSEAYQRMLIAMLLEAVEGLDPEDPDCWPGWAALAPHCGAPVVDFVKWRLEHGRVDLAGLTGALTVLGKVSRYLLARRLPHQVELFLADVLRTIPAELAEDPLVLDLRHEYGRGFLEQGLLDAAEAELAEVRRHRSRLLGENHADTLATRHKLARVMLDQGRWEEAEQSLRLILHAERQRDPTHPDTLTVWHSLVRAVERQERFAEAERELDLVLDAWRQWPHAHPEQLYAKVTKAAALLRLVRGEGAEAILRDVLVDFERQSWIQRPEYAQARAALGEALLIQDRVAEAAVELRAAYEWQEANLGPGHQETKRTEWLLASIAAPD